MSARAAEELLDVAAVAASALVRLREPQLQQAMTAIAKAAEEVGRSWSGSNIGYHATVYCAGLQPRPPNVMFSPEWGLEDAWPTHVPSAAWQIFDHQMVYDETLRRAGAPDVDVLETTFKPIRELFVRSKETAISTITAAVGSSDDKYLQRKLDQVQRLQAPDVTTIIARSLPSQAWSRDRLALSQGIKPAPHSCAAAIPQAASALEGALDHLERSTREAASHLHRTERQRAKANVIGTNVFIGHGRSPLWRELKDFVEDRLQLPVDEFNSVPVAGISTPERLSELLDAAAFAFLVMTAEDEHADGSKHARLNVVHEVGLFQGRLSFNKAIILLEEGCEEFSNVHGLGQIRFPKGNISAKFEDIRAVLEREGLL
jgi:predicted nucleotide-binding protein